jgi:hypothetical protein
LIRQGERTIDNLKRLFAVVFAISFAVVSSAVIEKLRPLLSVPSAVAPPLWLWVLNAEMIAVLVVTHSLETVSFLRERH